MLNAPRKRSSPAVIGSSASARTYPKAFEKCTRAAVSALRSGTCSVAGDVRNTPRCCSQRAVCAAVISPGPVPFPTPGKKSVIIRESEREREMEMEMERYKMVDGLGSWYPPIIALYSPFQVTVSVCLSQTVAAGVDKRQIWFRFVSFGGSLEDVRSLRSLWDAFWNAQVVLLLIVGLLKRI